MGTRSHELTTDGIRTVPGTPWKTHSQGRQRLALSGSGHSRPPYSWLSRTHSLGPATPAQASGSICWGHLLPTPWLPHRPTPGLGSWGRHEQSPAHHPAASSTLLPPAGEGTWAPALCVVPRAARALQSSEPRKGGGTGGGVKHRGAWADLPGQRAGAARGTRRPSTTPQKTNTEIARLVVSTALRDLPLHWLSAPGAPQPQATSWQGPPLRPVPFCPLFAPGANARPSLSPAGLGLGETRDLGPPV